MTPYQAIRTRNLAKIQAAYEADLKALSPEGASRFRTESMKEFDTFWAKLFAPGMIINPNHKGEGRNGKIIDWTVHTGCVKSQPYQSGGRWVVEVIWFGEARKEFGTISTYPAMDLDPTGKKWDKFTA